MTRKDYELIAWTIKTTMISPEARAEAAHAFAVTLRSTNARFDVDRFLSACIWKRSEKWFIGHDKDWYYTDKIVEI
jgi:hypothetical protein